MARRRNLPRGLPLAKGELGDVLIRAHYSDVDPRRAAWRIWSGVFTPTEAAAVAAVYSLAIAY